MGPGLRRGAIALWDPPTPTLSLFSPPQKSPLSSPHPSPHGRSADDRSGEGLGRGSSPMPVRDWPPRDERSKRRSGYHPKNGRLGAVSASLTKTLRGECRSEVRLTRQTGSHWLPALLYALIPEN